MTEFGPLFDYVPPAPSSPKPELTKIEISKSESQPEALERVSSRIGAAIVEFCKARVGKQFHADELRAYVEQKCGPTAPGSADRVLRDLRQRNVIAYRNLSRKLSLYEVTGA